MILLRTFEKDFFSYAVTTDSVHKNGTMTCPYEGSISFKQANDYKKNDLRRFIKHFTIYQVYR